MGRGSRQAQQGQSSAAAAAAAAAAAPPQPPPAAEAVPDDDEGVWRLLLGELWQPPEQQVVCRLLCCSRAMARLVHELCAGRVVASISRQPSQAGSTPEWQQQVTARGAAYSTWLAKHARLLAELRLDVWGSQDESVAAGLVAAAQPQPLPLHSLALTTSSVGGWTRLLPSLAEACPQLTQLQVAGSVAAGSNEQQQLVTAFTALRHLRELSLSRCALQTVRALQLSTQLTKLRLDRVQLSGQAFSSLPASLVELEHVSYRALPPAGHLTALTRLKCFMLDEGSSVPPSVQQLKLAWCDNPAPLHHLTRLRSLECGDMLCSLEELQAAVAAIGPSLAALDMGAYGDLGPALPSQRVSGPSLPLTGLTVRCGATSVAHLGQWTGLTRLALHWVARTETPQRVAQQLQQLTALRQLELRVHHRSDNEDEPPPSLQPLVDVVVGMSSLRSLRFAPVGGLDAQQRAQLHGMTQLTKLHM